MTTDSVDERQEMRRRFEARKLTHDGPIWPVRREEMRHSATICERMAEDLAHLRPANHATLRALRDVGWTEEQVHRHGLFAARIKARP